MNRNDYRIFPLGDSSLTVDFGNRIDVAVNKTIIHFANGISRANLPGVRDVVPAYSSLTVHYDVYEVAAKARGEASFTAMKQWVEEALAKSAAKEEAPSRHIRIPVCYAEKYALDKEEMCEKAHLFFDKIIQIHTSAVYRVYMVGFLPGFAYMGEVDARIAVARKDEPRTLVEAGSVGIAGAQTGVYPLSSPGGWQIIGRTPLKSFDVTKEEPAFCKAGDEVQFFSISEDEFANY